MPRLRDRLSPGTRHRLAMLRVSARRPTASFRALPDFLVIGAQRGGTSSLYRWLGSHPDVFPSVRKETEFFSSYVGRGVNWYRAHFPHHRSLARHADRHGTTARTFEATPDYLFDPRAPASVAELLPDARLIVLLRDPVERAFSHYKHMRRLGFEARSFPEAVATEHERIDEDLKQALAQRDHRPVLALRHSYVARGRYVEQLERWFAHFPRSQFLVVDSAELFAAPTDAVRRICDFLDISPWAPDAPENHSYRSVEARRESQSAAIPDDLKADLARQFEDANTGLEDLVGFSLNIAGNAGVRPTTHT